MQTLVGHKDDESQAQYAELAICNCRASVCLFVRLSRPNAAAADLLLWARQPGDIDRLLHGGPAVSSSRGTAACCGFMRAVPRCQLT